MLKNILKTLLLMWLNDERPCFLHKISILSKFYTQWNYPSKENNKWKCSQTNKIEWIIATIHALKETKELFAENEVDKGQKLIYINKK